MKKLIIAAMVCSFVNSAHAQLFDRIKNKVKDKVNEKVDQAVDKTIEKATEPKKKTTPVGTDQTGVGINTPDASVNTSTTINTSVPVTNKPAVSTNITSYSRFDFVPGDKIIMEENFNQDVIGEFPAKWDTHSGAELVTVNNRPGKWLAIKQAGVFFPEYLTGNLPDNFTLQADIMANNEIPTIASITVGFMQIGKTDDKYYAAGHGDAGSTPGFRVELTPVSSGEGVLRYSTNVIGGNSINGTPAFNVPKKNSVKLSIWRQKQRIRLYLDDTKIFDLPRALDAATVLNTLFFNAYAPEYGQAGGTFYIGNIRLAVGAPDIRNKLITEGKFTTHGILFASNSDEIQPESYGALKEIAAVLKENAGIRVNIIGHTDADGNDQLNLELSKKRAAAVKTALITNFSIETGRMETSGKGKTQPIADNTTEIGKANNRRVEFIKL
ncbi:OmpA family protein [Chitinophaga pendula]|uniref:OmpA family protein n=1 Tax=Chitinophaga TaxID=79328 RepID=UPI000BB0C75C|nr:MULTISPECIES: OmpA family protein [Chitinophaga]ASZ12617.1 hypothetical protein CK934_17465 [Chitinophaga sp. MD30]UCJ09776.1 OmpA family protein [Chitinophaga pendula]